MSNIHSYFCDDFRRDGLNGGLMIPFLTNISLSSSWPNISGREDLGNCMFAVLLPCFYFFSAEQFRMVQLMFLCAAATWWMAAH